MVRNIGGQVKLLKTLISPYVSRRLFDTYRSDASRLDLKLGEVSVHMESKAMRICGTESAL
ncbi:hypothetical protein DOT_2881 [Desulfosporosinus sp. OT]|nr:hypothetical protein DOT_2881 [Desulfosporosinus sp. OT]